MRRAIVGLNSKSTEYTPSLFVRNKAPKEYYHTCALDLKSSIAGFGYNPILLDKAKMKEAHALALAGEYTQAESCLEPFLKGNGVFASSAKKMMDELKSRDK
jgi:hypothetical protein